MTLQELKAEADRLLADYRLAARRVSEERAGRVGAKAALSAAAHARDGFQAVAAAVQRAAHEKIEGVVSKAVAVVYPGGYTFHVEFVKRRGKTEADLYFRRGELRLHPEDGCGQGMVDVAAFALRLISLRLRRPRPRQVLIGDEMFKNVNGAGNRRRCAALVKALSVDLGIQVIMTTGYDWLREAGDIVIDLLPAASSTPAGRSTRRRQSKSRRPRPS